MINPILILSLFKLLFVFPTFSPSHDLSRFDVDSFLNLPSGQMLKYSTSPNATDCFDSMDNPPCQDGGHNSDGDNKTIKKKEKCVEYNSNYRVRVKQKEEGLIESIDFRRKKKPGRQTKTERYQKSYESRKNKIKKMNSEEKEEYKKKLNENERKTYQNRKLKRGYGSKANQNMKEIREKYKNGLANDFEKEKVLNERIKLKIRRNKNKKRKTVDTHLVINPIITPFSFPFNIPSPN